MEKKRITVSVSTIGLVLILGVFLSSQPESLACQPVEPVFLAPQEKSSEPKLAEQVYKNIQVFQGLPASELQNTMFYMKAALNVNCNYCHVNFRDFEKDDNPKKQAARRMIQMVRALNQNQFGGKPEISCNTCHRGQAQPTAPLAFAAIRESRTAAKPADTSAAPNLPTVEQLFERYLHATGGQAAHEKLKTRRLTGVQLSSEGATRPFQLIQQMPDRFIQILTVDTDWYDTFDGTQGWSRDNHGTRDLTGKRLAQLRRENALYQPAALKAQYLNLKVIGVDKIGGRTVYVVEGSVPGLGTEQLHLDAETGLLLRITSSTKTLFGPLPEEIRLEDYREVDGVKLPFQVSFLKPDFSELYKFTEVKHNVVVDAQKFERPK